MRERKTRHAASVAIVDQASGKARRVEPTKMSRLDKTKLIAVLKETGMTTKDGSVELTSHVVLTAQNPWEENKGYLNALNARTWFADGPSVNFVPEAGQPTGRLEAWLEGLEPDSMYVARIEVGASGSSPLDVRAVTLGSSISAQTFSIPGGFDTLLLQFSSGDGGLGLLRIECPDWSFYELEVSRVEI